MLKKTLPLAVVSLAVSLPGHAQEESPADAFSKCARIASDARRLSCYDRLAADLIELGPAAVGLQPPPAPPPAATPSPEAAPAAVATEAPAPQPEQTSEATPQPAPARTSAADEFGIERTDERPGADVDKITSRYKGDFTGWSGDTVFELENGQVWKQIQSGRMSWRATNPMITIERGFMGSYRLSVEGVNRTVRVKRLK